MRATKLSNEKNGFVCRIKSSSIPFFDEKGRFSLSVDQTIEEETNLATATKTIILIIISSLIVLVIIVLIIEMTIVVILKIIIVMAMMMIMMMMIMMCIDGH